MNIFKRELWADFADLRDLGFKVIVGSKKYVADSFSCEIKGNDENLLHCALCGATNKVLFTGPYGPTCEDCIADTKN